MGCMRRAQKRRRFSSGSFALERVHVGRHCGYCTPRMPSSMRRASRALLHDFPLGARSGKKARDRSKMVASEHDEFLRIEVRLCRPW